MLGIWLLGRAKPLSSLQGKGALLHTEWTKKWHYLGSSTCVRVGSSNPGFCGCGVIQDLSYFWRNACPKCVNFAASFVCGKCVQCLLINLGLINTGELLLPALIDGRALPAGREHRGMWCQWHRCPGHLYAHVWTYFVYSLCVSILCVFFMRVHILWFVFCMLYFDWSSMYFFSWPAYGKVSLYTGWGQMGDRLKCLEVLCLR